MSDESTYFRKVIRITAEDSPNVKRGLQQRAAGIVPDGKEVIPGVLGWGEYLNRLATWDEIRKTIGLWAQFYKGKEVWLYPALARQRSLELASKQQRPRRATGIGIDTAEGGDMTSMVAGDEEGIIAARSRKTPNTDVVCGEVIAFGVEFACPPERWAFDSGGGGKQHADRLRGLGYKVQTVAFGSKPTLDLKRGMHMLIDRKDMREDQYVYLNMRAEMYHTFSLQVEEGYGIPNDSPALVELHRQMSLIPKMTNDWSMWDAEGRIRMLPKQKRQSNTEEMTLTEILGHSPDELDAAVLCYHAVTTKKRMAKVMVG